MSRKLPHRGLLYASLIVGMVLGAEAAHAAIIATDDVEVDNYTYTGAIAQGPNLRDSGDQGLTAQAGTKFMSLSQSGAQNPGPGTLVLNGGFGPGTPIQAGTYQVTVLAGEGNIDRQTWTSFDVFLRTLGGIELPDRSVITPFVNPNTPTTAEWIPTTVQYIVPLDSPLVGEQFTWGANYVIPSQAFYGAWDAVSVDFTETPSPAIPEPGSLILLGFGALAMLRRRRRALRRRAE